MYELTLNDFDYEINGNNLIFKKLLNNKEKDIKLLDKYTIDGKDYIVNEIGSEAFKLNFMNNVELPDTIEIIRNYSFSKSGIKKINIPPKVSYIPDNCFDGCENLTDVVLHDDIKYISNNAFAKTNISNFIFPKKVDIINEGCFFECKNLTNVILHDNIREIKNSAFSHSGIEKFICPKNVDIIPNFCFNGCKNLKNIILHNNIKKIKNYAFVNTGIEKFVVPPKVTEIPEGCFSDCENLYEIDLNNVKTIKKHSFSNSKNLNISHQNDKDIYIDNYQKLVYKGFIDKQINQILKGYENGIFLNNLPIDTSVDIFRIIINNFSKYPEQFLGIIKQLESEFINLNNKLKLYDKINKLSNNINLDEKNIEHTI